MLENSGFIHRQEHRLRLPITRNKADMRTKSIFIHFIPWTITLCTVTWTVYERARNSEAQIQVQKPVGNPKLGDDLRKASAALEIVVSDFLKKGDDAPFEEDLHRELARRLGWEPDELLLKIHQGQQSDELLLRAHALYLKMAKKKAVEAARESRRLHLNHSLQVSETYVAEARALTMDGDWRNAIDAYRAALDLIDRELNPVEWMASAECLLRLLSSTGRRAEAEALLRELFRVQSSNLGESDPATLVSLRALCSLRLMEDMRLEAGTAFERLDEIIRFGLEKDDWKDGPKKVHPTKLAYQKGDFQSSEKCFREILQQDEADLGPNHISVAIDLHNLAGTLAAQDKKKEADDLYRRSQSIFADFLKANGKAHRHAEFSRIAYKGFLKESGKSEEEIRSVMESIHGKEEDEQTR
jgi:tetratricopeptide (TPR) repeat protein